MTEETYISLAENLRYVAVEETFRYIQDADDVEDIAQEVMLRIWEKRAGLSSNVKMLNAYAATLARNICLDRHKIKRRHPLLLRLQWFANREDNAQMEIPVHDTPQRQLEQTEAINAYYVAVKKLPYGWQRILRMRGEEEMSYAEIAQILGTSESSVRGTLCKAKKKVLELIKQNR